MKTNQKRNKNRGMRCPYCGAPVVFRSADGIYRENHRRTMLYVCSRYPICDAYVRAHPGTKIPMGELADPELRTLRRTAHQYFDQLHESGYMTKKDAYRWLAATIDAPMQKAHIGWLGDYYCRKVITESRRLLENRNKNREEASTYEAHR